MSALGGRRVRATAAAIAGVAAVPPSALAHEGRPLAPHDLWSAWEWSPAVTIPLLLLAALYAIGVRRVWARAGRRRGVRARDVLCFGTGWLTLAIAVVSPLHALGGVLFAAHMTQHELLMVVAAPLLVLGQPVIACLWVLPWSWRLRIGALARRRGGRCGWGVATVPPVAWGAHAVALGVWHLPAPYEATSVSDALHGLQHLSFFATALVFWWALLRPGRGREGESVLYLFAATLVTGALGALLAFASEPWYPHYAATTGAWGLSPLEDQQLGGVIMWVPGGGGYLLAALMLMAGWLRESERRARRRDARGGSALATWNSA